MDTFIAAFGGVGVVLSIIFALISILTPIWIYFIYLYTGRSREELRAIRALLEQQLASKAPAAAKYSGALNCPHCSKQIKYPQRMLGQIKPCPNCKVEITLQG